MPIGTQTGVIRGQNINAQESEQDRIARLQTADIQDATARAQLAQQYKMYEGDAAWREKLKADAEEEARNAQRYGIAKDLASGGLSVLGSVLGKAL